MRERMWVMFILWSWVELVNNWVKVIFFTLLSCACLWIYQHLIHVYSPPWNRSSNSMFPSHKTIHGPPQQYSLENNEGWQLLLSICGESPSSFVFMSCLLLWTMTICTILTSYDLVCINGANTNKHTMSCAIISILYSIAQPTQCLAHKQHNNQPNSLNQRLMWCVTITRFGTIIYISFINHYHALDIGF